MAVRDGRGGSVNGGVGRGPGSAAVAARAHLTVFVRGFAVVVVGVIVAVLLSSLSSYSYSCRKGLTRHIGQRPPVRGEVSIILLALRCRVGVRLISSLSL